MEGLLRARRLAAQLHWLRGSSARAPLRGESPQRRCWMGRRAGGPAAQTERPGTAWAAGRAGLREGNGRPGRGGWGARVSAGGCGHQGATARGAERSSGSPAAGSRPCRQSQPVPALSARCARGPASQLAPRPPPSPCFSPDSACPVLTKEGPSPLSTARSCCARCGAFDSKEPEATSASTRVMKPPSAAATCTDRAASSAGGRHGRQSNATRASSSLEHRQPYERLHEQRAAGVSL